MRKRQTDTFRFTRFPGLFYRQDDIHLWRWYVGGYAVGPHYHSKVELLADMKRYAIEYGLASERKGIV